MSIRLAASTTAFADWSLSSALTELQTMGYVGVDLATRFGRGKAEFTCDPRRENPSAIRDQLTAAGLSPVCLSTNITFSDPSDETGHAAASWTRDAAKLAAELGAPAVCVLAGHTPRGEHPRTTLGRIARRALAVADDVGAQGVQLLFENGGSYCTARDWWWALDVARHPMVGLVWNPATAAVAGELPAVSVPMLNSKIRMVRLSDLEPADTDGRLSLDRPAPLGQGVLDIPALLHRLMGVGYQGDIVVDWDRLARPGIAAVGEVLPEARQQMADWIKAVQEAGKPPAKPVKKPVAKVTPKPATAVAPIAPEKA